MDAFKILTRSANLKKSKAQGLAPSAGQLNSPQLFETSNESRQKRDGSRDGEAPKKRRKLNGDGVNGGSSQIAGKKQGSPSGSMPHGKRNEEQRLESSLPREECRRKLRAHKIKVMRLSDDLVASDEEKMTKKRKKESRAIYPQPLISFGDLRERYGMSRRLVQNIHDQGYRAPSEIQLVSLPLLLGIDSDRGFPCDDGENPSTSPLDVLAVAPTGSGKTLAFLLPLFEAVLSSRDADTGDKQRCGPFAVVVAPTKELARQIVNEGRKLASGLSVRITLMRKGMLFPGSNTSKEVLQASPEGGSETEEEDEVKTIGRSAAPTHVDIVVSTPLLLVNSLSDQSGSAMTLSTVRHLVLDEADVLLDPLFRDQTMAIWNACDHPQLRVGLWSATMGSNIEELARSHIEHRQSDLPPADRSVMVRLVVGLKDSAIPNISHKLVYAANESGKLLALRQLLRPTSTSAETGLHLRPPFLIFTQTITRAIALQSELIYDIPKEAGGSSRIAVLHSDLSENQRYDIMTRFGRGEIWVLITTDLLARGVDFRGINGVVNYDIPNSSTVYVHRVGRTGRAGREGGVAVTYYTKEDIPYVKNIANVIAASEKQKGARKGTDVQEWLLHILPDTTKRSKQRLKTGGVEARREHDGKSRSEKGNAKSRISTKSGFERRLENNRKGAIEASRKRKANAEAEPAVHAGSDDAWEGFGD